MDNLFLVQMTPLPSPHNEHVHLPLLKHTGLDLSALWRQHREILLGRILQDG